MKRFGRLIVDKYFKDFGYFFKYLRYKVFVVVGLSILVGILDGFGLAMFLPLLEVAGGSNEATSSKMGSLSFLVDWLDYFDIDLTIQISLLFIAFFFFLKGIIVFLSGYYKVSVHHLFLRKIRIENFNLLGLLRYKYFLDFDMGRLQNSLTAEVDRVGRAYGAYFATFQHAILVVVYMFFALLIDWKFAILVSFGGSLSNLFFKFVYVRTKISSRNLTSGGSGLLALTQQSVYNFKYLKSTGQLKSYLARVRKQALLVEQITNSIAKYGNILFAVREPTVIFVVCAVIYIQIQFLESSLDSVLVSLLFFYRALHSLMSTQSSWNTFLQVGGSLDNMTIFTQELKNNRDEFGSLVFTKLEDEIEFRNVSLFYGEKQVLKNISFNFPKASVSALVGESGSGKTSVINLLSGLIPQSSGHLTIDGVSLNKYDVVSYQKRIGYISQDPVIFNDTVFNNVTFWDEPTSENLERFFKACDLAAILGFVLSLENVEHELLGNNGINLSGGQKQRISIARELYKDIDILILDEATSSLDSETEKEIQSNIEMLRGKYTIIIIAHRLSTVKTADNIILMGEGSKLAEGSFQNLVDTVPSFKRMVEFQGLLF